jgi:rhodanese-related sulfurtransferase
MNILNILFNAPVETIGVQELHEKIEKGQPPFILDVREPEEYRMGHIADAKLIPLGQLERRISEVPRDREIVCICASGHRSMPAVQALKAAGYTARSMKNGMIAWQLARLPVDKGTWIRKK